MLGLNSTSEDRNTGSGLNKRQKIFPKLDLSGIQKELDEMDKLFNHKILTFNNKH